MGTGAVLCDLLRKLLDRRKSLMDAKALEQSYRTERFFRERLAIVAIGKSS